MSALILKSITRFYRLLKVYLGFAGLGVVSVIAYSLITAPRPVQIRLLVYLCAFSVLIIELSIVISLFRRPSWEACRRIKPPRLARQFLIRTLPSHRQKKLMRYLRIKFKYLAQ